MEVIYNFFAAIFGYVMNFFYITLDFIGLPYLWLCIVLFAVLSRLLFIPQKIGSARKGLLAATINYEIRQLRNTYGSINKDDKERTKAYKKDTKAIFKKYKVSSGTGCLMTLMQLPIFVGLFRVVKEPFTYVPSLTTLTESEKLSINDFFGFSLDSLPQDFGAIGIIIPLIVLLGSFIHTAPTLFNKSTKKQPILLILNILQPLLLTWMSFCFPIAISLYWVVNDLTNLAITKLIESYLNNNQEIKKIIENTAVLIEAEKSAKEKEGSEKVGEATEPTVLMQNGVVRE